MEDLITQASILFQASDKLLPFLQPKVDLLHLMEGLQEYSGILSTFPEIINIHKVQACLLYVCLSIYHEKLTWKLVHVFIRAFDCPSLVIMYLWVFFLLVDRRESKRL